MKTHRIVPACVAGIALLRRGTSAVPAHAQTAAKRRPRIAVMDFDYATVQTVSAAVFGTNVDIGKGIVDLLVTDLVKDGTYSVIERKALDKILAEQNFSNSNRADPTSAARIGKILGVDAIIVGSITEFGNETKKTGLGGVRRQLAWRRAGQRRPLQLQGQRGHHRPHHRRRHRRDPGRRRRQGPVQPRQHQPAGRRRQLERLWRRAAPTSAPATSSRPSSAKPPRRPSMS